MEKEKKINWELICQVCDFRRNKRVLDGFHGQWKKHCGRTMMLRKKDMKKIIIKKGMLHPEHDICTDCFELGQQNKIKSNKIMVN